MGFDLDLGGELLLSSSSSGSGGEGVEGVVVGPAAFRYLRGGDCRTDGRVEVSAWVCVGRSCNSVYVFFGLVCCFFPSWIDSIHCPH